MLEKKLKWNYTKKVNDSISFTMKIICTNVRIEEAILNLIVTSEQV